MLDANQQDRGGPGHGIGLHDSAQFPAQPRGSRGRRRTGSGSLCSLPVPDQRRIHPVELAQQPAKEPGRRRVPGRAEMHPLALADPLDEACFGEDSQVPRHPRLTLSKHCGQVDTLSSRSAHNASSRNRVGSAVARSQISNSRESAMPQYINICTIL